ncbi:MAG: hypothetical protein HY897_02875 [Deltaproteobacteria bacterium]|nr:hypothetical protein [Deltaproteobacteria bacterium]
MTRTTHIAALLAALAAVSTTASAQDARGAGSGWETDEDGRVFRTAFDPGSRFILGPAFVVGDTGRGADARPAITAGLWYRQTISSGMKHDLVRWQLEHRAFTGSVHPGADGPDGWPSMDLSAYHGAFLRHAENATITLPSDPPRQIRFPLDIGVETEVGRVRIDPWDADGRNAVRLGLARAAVLLDPWRPGRPGNGLEIGVGVRYDLDIGLDPGAGARTTVHRVAPFTATSVRWRVQDGAGLTALEVRADSVPHWRSGGGFSFFGEASSRFERVLVALNDQPLSLVVGAASRVVEGKSGEWVGEHRAILGMAFGFQR